MKKIAIIPMIAVAVLVSACGESTPEQKEEHRQAVEDRANRVYKEICIDGVTYLYRGSGKRESITAKFGTDSKVVLCD